MDLKQYYFANNLKSVNKTTPGKNGGFRSVNPSNFGAESNKAHLKEAALRFGEMEAINANLKRLVEEQTKNLTEVVKTNAKFLSIIAHDLRSPFTAILGFLELIKEELDDHNINDIEENLNIVTDSANSILKLIDNLLVWAISQDNSISFNPVKINIYQLLEEEFENAKISAKLKQVTLSHSISPDLNLSADLQMVKAIFRNLISNAIKFSNAGGQIKVSAYENKQFVEIAVEDNGIGISSKTLRNLLKTKDFHATEGISNKHGTGLGLVICREFIEVHGGKLQVDSEPGVGSRFRFILPHYI
jgi:two-component system, sensor histidine kinase and response regulator